MLLTLFSAVFLIFLIYNPALCTLGATKGLSLWYKQVLPALFPAMAAASFLISRKSVQAALKHLPFPSGAAFLSGLLCGSPMGALTCSGLYASKLLSKRAARWIVCFVQLPSPLFLSGFVASALLALPTKMRFVFVLCAYLPFFASFLLCTLLFLLKSVAKRSISTKKNVQETSSPEPSLNDICDTCLLLLVRIGVLLMFFSILSEFLTSVTPQSTAQTILIGMLEMTTGISKISSSIHFLCVTNQPSVFFYLALAESVFIFRCAKPGSNLIFRYFVTYLCVFYLGCAAVYVFFF